ncbi:MAG: VOC family protein [Pseudohongiellaceae bacterium]
MTTSSPTGRIGQISRTVSSIEASKNWYELVLELPHLYTFGTLSFFDCNGTRLMLTQEGTTHADESILYFKVDDILGTCDRLQQKGVKFTHAPHRIHTHADGTEEWMAFFNDPDGRPLALMAQVKPNA